MSRIGIHWQQSASWMRRVAMPAPYVKVVNPSIDDVFPGKRTIGRVYMTDGEEGAFYSRGAQGGADYFMRCLGWYRQAPYVHAWESWNEPAVIKTPSERCALDQATGEWSRLMREHGYRSCAGNFSERNPPDGTIREFEQMLDRADYLGMHCYDAPTMQSHGYCLRYRQIIVEIEDAGLRVPPLLIGECGIDGGVIGKGGRGWQKFASWEQYLTDLQWYERQLSANDDVAGAFLFTAGATGKWKSFEVSEKQARSLAAWQTSYDALEPFEPPLPALPENEQGGTRTLAEKATWWQEEIVRSLEANDYAKALRLANSQCKLLARLRDRL